MNQNKAYGDIEMYSPDDQLMFRTNQSRLKSYIKKGLVEKLNDKKFRFNFVPKGLGYGERNKGLLEPRENRCVRCGDEDLFVLTRHHIVPSRFRRHLPDNIKGHNHKYVVFLCCECHNEYGHHENRLNDMIAEEMDTKTLKECTEEIHVEKRIITGLADTILFKHNVPEHRLEQLKMDFQRRTGLEPNVHNLIKVRKSKYEPVSKENDFGRIIINKIKNIYEFQQRWLEHFVNTMQPKYLPKDLSILLTKEDVSQE